MVAGCQSGDEESVAPHTAPEALAYPRLQTIPPPREPTLDAAARQSVVAGLVADRERASYTSRVVRYRSGRSSLPPPREPPPASADPTARSIVGPARPPDAPAAAADDEASSYEGFAEREVDDGSLDGFMRDLMRDTEPTPAEDPAPEPQAAVEPPAPPSSVGAGRLAQRERLPGGERLLAGFGLRPRPEEAPVPFRAAPPRPATPSRAEAEPPAGVPPSERGGPLIVSDGVTLAASDDVPERAAVRYALAAADPGPAAAAPAASARPLPAIRPAGDVRAKGDLAIIPFTASATAVPDYVRPMLRHAAAVAREDGGLVVVARSQAPEVARQRARAVGEILLALGVEAEALRLLADGEGGREEIRIDPARR